MKTKIAINGFGRIGRNAFKIGFGRPDLQIVAINDLTDTKTLAYLLKHDSAYGTYEQEVGFDEQNLIINGQPIKVLAEKDPAALPWKDLGVEVVIESTGFFVDPDKARAHITAGAKRVIISAPAKGDNADSADTIVLGVNEDKLKDGTDIISNASCTTNCITPVAAVVESAFGIEKLMMTTIHSYTASQKLQDAPGGKALRDGRAAAENIVPTTTGASIAAAKALPSLKGIFGGFEVRVPTPVVSLADFAIVTKKNVTVEEVNEAFKQAAKEPFYQGIMDVTEEELVSTDFIGNSHSAIVDLPLTNVVGGNLLKVVAWYDNEWGYSNRLVELTADTGRQLHDNNGGSTVAAPKDTNQKPADDSQKQNKDEKPGGLIEAPTTDDFLPPAEPHDTPDQHSPVEGNPGLEGPAQTLPAKGMPTDPILPDTEPAGPDKPHEF
jgi:glyceraldehyde 3-phosphate dehydrogenase